MSSHPLEPDTQALFTVPSASDENTEKPAGFAVETAQYSGPFDLLLDLVSKRELDITSFALAEVTDGFLQHIKENPKLAEISEFLVIAATLLDIKAARLLPGEEALSSEDLEMLEARDLLLSRLLQYRVYKEASTMFSKTFEQTKVYVPRLVPLEKHFLKALGPIELTVDAKDLAKIAAEAIFQSPPQVMVTHLHDPLVPVEGQITYILQCLEKKSKLTFQQLVEDATSLPVVISRFLAILDLYRNGLVSLEQNSPLAVLKIMLIKSKKTLENLTETIEEDGNRNLESEKL